MNNNRYQQSKSLLESTKRIIPLASQTFSKSHIQYPEQAPHFIVRGQGATVWDVDGNAYIDFINGLLPVILGHCDPDVDTAVKAQIDQGVCFSLPSPLEGELAQLLVDIIPCAEMVRFGKNGSDATAGAVRAARAYTGRERLAVCGYHGWQDWYIGSTTRNAGVPRSVRELTHPFLYNDLGSLEMLLKQYPDEIAAVIMEPMTVEAPKPGFLEGVRDLAHDHGALFIMDEIITGFRFALGGAQELFGITPDLAAIGKSMANGFPIAAVVGKKQYMDVMEDIFFSSTFGGDTLSIVAALETIRKIKRDRVIDDLWRKGKNLIRGVTSAIQRHGLEDVMQLKGLAPWTLLSIGDHNAISSWEIKSLFQQEMLRCGILMSASHNLSFAHTDDDIAKLINCYDEALEFVAEAVTAGTVVPLLQGRPIEPLFKVR